MSWQAPRPYITFCRVVVYPLWSAHFILTKQLFVVHFQRNIFPDYSLSDFLIQREREKYNDSFFFTIFLTTFKLLYSSYKRGAWQKKNENVKNKHFFRRNWRNNIFFPRISTESRTYFNSSFLCSMSSYFTQVLHRKMSKHIYHRRISFASLSTFQVLLSLEESTERFSITWSIFFSKRHFSYFPLNYSEFQRRGLLYVISTCVLVHAFFYTLLHKNHFKFAR